MLRPEKSRSEGRRPEIRGRGIGRPRRRLSLQTLEQRQLMAADTGLPTGAITQDTGEFLLGRVAVTPIFLESDGSIDPESQNWTPEEIDEVLGRITEGVNWWADALDSLDTVHTLEFVIDDTYARAPLEIGYEPIDRRSNDYDRYVSEFLDFKEIDSALPIDEGMFAFNDAQREKLDTDWAFSIFVADSSDDADQFFPSNGSFRGAFAFAGGLFFVMPSTRPVTTITHEMGHIFWGLDEYAGGGTYHDSRGYYDTQNENAFDNPTLGFTQQNSIMADFNRLVTSFETFENPESTLALLGWQDSDGDGIFDVLDVPLSLEGTGSLDESTSQFRFIGDASVNTLINQNPSGPQSDITLNRISRLEVAIDGGGWQTVAEPDTPTASFDLLVDVPEVFTTIDFRVIDAATGVTSPILSATPTTPLLNSTPLVGFSYIDNNRDGRRSAGEPLPAETVIEVRPVGNQIATGQVAADAVTLDTNVDTTAGITLGSDSETTGSAIQAQINSNLSSEPLFHLYDEDSDRWTAGFNRDGTLDATFDEPTSYVEVDAIALTNGLSYARVEAYDSAGNLIARTTTDIRNTENGGLAFGEEQMLVLHDQESRIAAVKVFGHGGSNVGVSAIRYGVPMTITTDAHGAFSLAAIPDGTYEIVAAPQNTDYIIETQTVGIQSGAIVGEPLVLESRPIFSPRYNQTLSEDVNGDGVVTAVDALQVINDLNSIGSRSLPWDDSAGSMIDVTNDGEVTSLDALRIINRLNSTDQGGQSEPLAMAVVEDDDDDDNDGLVDANPIDEIFAQPIKWVSRV